MDPCSTPIDPEGILTTLDARGASPAASDSRTPAPISEFIPAAPPTSEAPTYTGHDLAQAANSGASCNTRSLHTSPVHLSRSECSAPAKDTTALPTSALARQPPTVDEVAEVVAAQATSRDLPLIRPSLEPVDAVSKCTQAYAADCALSPWTLVLWRRMVFLLIHSLHNPLGFPKARQASIRTIWGQIELCIASSKIRHAARIYGIRRARMTETRKEIPPRTLGGGC